ncbi:MAG: MlaD family protein, partial [Myxococcota bacterium]
MSTERERSTDIKVGVFVTLGLVLLSASIFLIGQERRLFEEPAYLKALFPNVSGLNVGAPVRLAGYEVGIVSDIRLPEPDANAEHTLFPMTSATRLPVGDSDLPITMTDGMPSAVNVTVRAFDPRSLLEFTVRVHGEDAHGKSGLMEDLRVRVNQLETTVTGHALFTKVTRLELRDLKNNDEGTSLHIGASRQRKVTVVMRIPADMLRRIRLDSEARVDSMGLLGDKTIDISIGSQDQPALNDGDFIKSAIAVDLNVALGDAQRVLDNVVASTDEMRRVLIGFTAAGGQDALAAAVRSVQA